MPEPSRLSADPEEMPLHSGEEVSLAQILAAREARQARQLAWLARHKVPLVSLTVLAPGAVKNTALTVKAFACGRAAVAEALAAKNWPVAQSAAWDLPTGAEAFFAVSAPAAELKRAMAELEESAPAGRLWDIDVLKTGGKILSRADFGLSARRCLICGRPAAECARARRHNIAELQTAMEALLCR